MSVQAPSSIDEKIGFLTSEVSNMQKSMEKGFSDLKAEIEKGVQSNEAWKLSHDQAERDRTRDIFDRINGIDHRVSDCEAWQKAKTESEKKVAEAKDTSPWGKFKTKFQENFINLLSLGIIGAIAFFTMMYINQLPPK